MATFFDDLMAAMDELEYIVNSTSRTHSIVKKSGGNYAVVMNRPDIKTERIVATLNCQNAVIGNQRKKIQYRRQKAIAFNSRVRLQ